MLIVIDTGSKWNTDDGTWEIGNFGCGCAEGDREKDA